MSRAQNEAQAMFISFLSDVVTAAAFSSKIKSKFCAILIQILHNMTDIYFGNTNLPFFVG
jgi:hypothetical protein